MSSFFQYFSSSQYVPQQNLYLEAFESVEKMKKFLNTEEEIQKVISFSQQSKSVSSNGRSITWLNSELKFYSLLKFGLDFFNPYLEKTCPDLLKKLKLKSIYIFNKNNTPYFQDLFQEQLLVRTLNVINPEHSAFYLHPSVRIRVRKFENQKLKSSGSSSKEFFVHKGICGAMCSLYAFLYFKTISTIKDPETCLKSIAQLFENGGIDKVGFLQLFNWTDADLRDHLLNLSYQDSISITSEDLKKQEDQTLNLLDELPIGFYVLGLSKYVFEAHGMLFIKIDKKLAFYFDPNIGLLKLLSEDLTKDLIKKLLFTTQLINLESESVVEFTTVNFNVDSKTNYTVSLIKEDGF